MNNLKGKCYFITGASSGIGAGIARILAREGADLVLHYNKNEQGIETTRSACKAAGVRTHIIQWDFRELSGLKNIFAQAWEAFEGLDGLVNNAGIVPKLTSLKDPDGVTFNETLAVNLQAPYQLSNYFAQHAIEAKQNGVIINNTSIHGQQSCEWFSAYGAAKAALDQITKVQAIEWGQYGIRVLAIAPGVVPVERTQHILEQDNVKTQWLKRTPLGRYGTPEDIAEAVTFMLSDKASWMTGSIMTVDGGLIARGDYPFREDIRN